MRKKRGRVIGLDVHPDSFAGAVVEGSDPASAQVLSTSTRVELEQLEQWALRHTRTEDTLVLEASGNAFAVAERLRAIGREVEILDSHRAGKVGKVYCANDRVDAVKIARIYLSALSPVVWQPDQKTLERREIFSAYQAVVKESTRAKQQLRSMLNEHCVRLEKGFRLCHPKAITRLHRPVRPCSDSLLTHGILNSFQRRSCSSGGTSSTCVATHQMLPQGSLTPPYRSPEGNVMMGKTETPPESSAE